MTDLKVPTLLYFLVNDLEIKPLNGKPWQELALVQFLNWMYVSCEVNLPDIKFSRKNVHQFHRYVGLSHDGTVNPDVADKIESVSKIDEDVDVQVYSLDYLHKYNQELFDILHKIKEVWILLVSYTGCITCTSRLISLIKKSIYLYKIGMQAMDKNN